MMPTPVWHLALDCRYRAFLSAMKKIGHIFAYIRKLKAYDVIYLGYPIWGGTYAAPVVTLVKKYDFAGKTIVPFCTFGSGGLESSSADLAEHHPDLRPTPFCRSHHLRPFL